MLALICRNSRFFAKISLPLLISFSSISHCIPFGAPDSRSAAMGKTGVAMASSTNAAYYNPALLAAFSMRKHLEKKQRIAFPTLSAFVSNNARELVDIDNADYDLQFERAVTDFNNNTNIENFINTLESLHEDLGNTSSEPLFADAQAGVILRIPDMHEGGAFSYSHRAVLDGKLNYTQADTVLIADYLEELAFVNAGGLPATLHPELYTDGQLVDPNNSLTSSIDAVALLIDELTFSMGWTVNLWGSDMMIGLAPKVVRVTTYESTANATSGKLTHRGKHDNAERLNFDLGWAKQIDDQLTVGLSIKNLIPRNYHTKSDRLIKLKSQVRMGIAYQTKRGDYAVDLDLIENDPLSEGDPTRELSVGGEWKIWNQHVRAGAVTNLSATGDNKSPLYTVGFRFQKGSFYSDFTYGLGNNQKCAALQLGLIF